MSQNMLLGQRYCIKPTPTPTPKNSNFSEKMALYIIWLYLLKIPSTINYLSTIKPEYIIRTKILHTIYPYPTSKQFHFFSQNACILYLYIFIDLLNHCKLIHLICILQNIIFDHKKNIFFLFCSL